MTEITEGTYPAKLKSWEIAEVEKINQLKLILWFDVQGSGWTKTMKWEEFFLKKDGTQNKKTYNTLKSTGFKYSTVEGLLEDDALNTEDTYTVTTEAEHDGDKTYWRVAWVNGDIESKGSIKDKTKLKGHNLSKLNSFLGSPKPTATPPPNMAPQSNDDIDSYLNS